MLIQVLGNHRPEDRPRRREWQTPRIAVFLDFHNHGSIDLLAIWAVEYLAGFDAVMVCFVSLELVGPDVTEGFSMSTPKPYIFGLFTLLSMALISPVLANQTTSSMLNDGDAIPGSPFIRYHTKDEFQRTITFYVSTPETHLARLKRAPIALYIQGSGCNSLFSLGPRGAIFGGYQNTLFDAASGAVRVVAVEKPGVKFLDDRADPGTALNCSAEFNEEHTLNR